MGSSCQFGSCQFPDLNLTTCHVMTTCLTVNNDTWARVFSSLNGTCQSLDRNTCDESFWIKSDDECLGNFTYDYDEDGCHDMSLARKSCFYQDYLNVKHILGITGIGLHNFSTKF